MYTLNIIRNNCTLIYLFNWSFKNDKKPEFGMCTFISFGFGWLIFLDSDYGWGL